MDDGKLNDLVDLLDGLTYVEWSRVKEGVDREFSRMRNRLTLHDKKSLESLLRMTVS